MTVLSIADINFKQLQQLLGRYHLIIHLIDDDKKISGSWFGEPEAGIIKNNVYVRRDTPVHSALHESCHYICMTPERREILDTDVGGDYDEENAVCYLSILLSDHIENFGRERMLSDMNEWGYTFRLGSSKKWFLEDAEDAEQWLIKNNIINKDNSPTWKVCISDE